MTNMKRYILIFVCLMTLLGCRAQQPTDTALRDDIGEMLLVGFRGLTADGSSTIARDIREYHIGGVILFEYDAISGKHHRNISSPQQLKTLCATLQGFADGRTLWISVDQEGGRVSRMKSTDGFLAIPSPETMAQKGADSVRHYAHLTAQMLSEAGINLNFAPCADVNINPDCPIIGKLGRSFSSDPQVVADCCSLWIAEQERHRVVSCLKHFPGHGSAKGDTHQGLVDISDTWVADELEPYRRLIAEGKVPMVMVAHVLNKHIDNGLPASLSPKFIDGWLRTDLQFDGVVITDDLAMGAIVKHYGYEEALALAIEAGSDMLCISNNGQTYDSDIVPRTVTMIERLVKEGRLSSERIHKSAERIRRAKRTCEKQ